MAERAQCLTFAFRKRRLLGTFSSSTPSPFASASTAYTTLNQAASMETNALAGLRNTYSAQATSTSHMNVTR